jgi:hypothetical protein
MLGELERSATAVADGKLGLTVEGSWPELHVLVAFLAIMRSPIPLRNGSPQREARQSGKNGGDSPSNEILTHGNPLSAVGAGTMSSSAERVRGDYFFSGSPLSQVREKESNACAK